MIRGWGAFSSFVTQTPRVAPPLYVCSHVYTPLYICTYGFVYLNKANRTSQITLLFRCLIYLFQLKPGLLAPLLPLSVSLSSSSCPPLCLLLGLHFSCMWFSLSSCAVSPGFMETWMSCHFQLPWVYSSNERVWEGKCFNRNVKHWVIAVLNSRWTRYCTGWCTLAWNNAFSFMTMWRSS